MNKTSLATHVWWFPVVLAVFLTGSPAASAQTVPRMPSASDLKALCPGLPERILSTRMPSASDRKAVPELWDIWRLGFKYYGKAEAKTAAGKYAESLPFYRRALEYFEEVKRRNSQWSTSVVAYRINLCRRRLRTAESRARETANNAAAPARNPDVTETAAPDHYLGKQFDRLRRENEQHKKELEALRRKTAELRTAASRAETAITQLRDLMREHAQLEQQFNSLKSQWEKAQADQTANRSRLAELEKELAVRVKQCRDFAAAADAAAKQNGELKKNTEKLRLNLADAVKRRDALADEMKKQTGQMAELETAAKEKDRSLAQLAQQRTAAENREKELTAEIQRNAGKIQMLRNDNVKYLAELNRLSAGRGAREKKTAVLRAANAELKAQLEKALSDEEKVRLRKEVKKLNRALWERSDHAAEEKLARQVKDKEQAINALMKEHQADKAEIEKLKQAVRESQARVLRWHSEAERLESAVKDAVHDARKFRTELRRFREEAGAAPPEPKRPRPGAVKIPVTEKSPAAAENDNASASTAITGVMKKSEPPPVSAEYVKAMEAGAAAEQRGDLAMALWQYWRAADMAGSRPEPYAALAKVHAKRREWASARKAYGKARKYGAKPDPELEAQIREK